MENFWNNILNFLKFQGLNILLGVLVFFVGLLIVKIAKKIFIKVLRKRHVDDSKISFTISIIDVLLKIVLVFITLSIMKFDTTSLIAIVSTCGVAIGLALKDSLSNIASGIILMYNMPFKKGDYVKVNNEQGKVLSVNLFTTTLKSVDNKKIIMPNSMVLNNSLTNYDTMPLRRLDMLIDISNENNYNQIKSILDDILNNQAHVLKSPKYDILIEEFVGTNIKILIKVWTKTENYWKLYYLITQDIFEKFNTNKIKFAYEKIKIID